MFPETLTSQGVEKLALRSRRSCRQYWEMGGLGSVARSPDISHHAPRSCHSPRNQHLHLRVEAFMCQRALKRHYRQNVAEVEQYVDVNCYISISILIWLFLSRCHATGCGFITTQQVRTTILHCGTYLRIILQTCGCVQISYHFIKGSSEQASSISWTEKGFSSYFSAIVYRYIFVSD